MAEDSSPKSLSRRAFLRRIGRVAPSGADETADAPAPAAGIDEASSDAERVLTPEEARRRLEALGVSLMPLSETEDRLQVQCKRVGEAFGPEEMRLLDPLAPRIAWLDLARTSVGDPALDIIGTMTDLRRLYFQHTAVEGDGLSALTALEQLEYLNLFGTKVGDSALAPLREIDSLQTVYLSQTNVSKAGVQELRDLRPDLTVEFGDPFFD